MSAGEERSVEVTFPDDYPAEHLAGKAATFAVEVKEVKEKRLPELDDDFAVEAGGYDSLDELRAEIEQRIAQAEERAIEGEFREAAVDAAVAGAKVEVPHELVHAKAHEMWHRSSRRLAAQGIDPRRYLELSGKTEEELVTEAEPEAEQALKREAVLAAIVAAEGIEVTEDEVTEALREAAGPDAGEEAAQARAQAGPQAGRRRRAARRHRDAQGGRPARGIGQADPGRDRRRPRQALDAGQGRRAGLGRDLDARQLRHFRTAVALVTHRCVARRHRGRHAPAGSRRSVLPEDALQRGSDPGAGRAPARRWSRAS